MKEQNAYHTDFEKEQQARDIAKKSVGEIIREHRTQKGLTQDALAAALYVTPQAISRWETGQTAPDINLLIPLAQLLDMSVDQLLGGNRRQEFEQRLGEAAMYGEAATLLVCEDALKEFPQDESFLYRRACAEFLIGKNKDMPQTERRNYLNLAAGHMWKLHQAYPDNNNYIGFLAQIYVQLGEREQARSILGKCTNPEQADRLLANAVLEGEEKINLQQQRISKRITELYNELLTYNTPDSIATAHALLDITMGKEKYLHRNYLGMLYFAQAEFCLNEGDMAGYEKHMMEAYEAAKAYDRDIASMDHYTSPLFDHITNDYDDYSLPDMAALVENVLYARKLMPPCRAKRLIIEQHIGCRPLNPTPMDCSQYYNFCDFHINQGLHAINFSESWDMSQEEVDALDQKFAAECHHRYPGHTAAYRVALLREQLVRLIREGIMSGYVACYKRGPASFLGYCNCGAKEKYKGMPDEWKTLTEPEGNRVFAIMELLSAPTFRDCGLEEKLVNHAMTEAKAQGFTHVQTCLWERLYWDKEGNDTFEHLLALYTSLGFTVHADWSDEHRKVYLMQKEL